MNITTVNPDSFANGFSYFCTNCNMFFSVQAMNEYKDVIEHCPSCGCDELICSAEELLEHCADNGTDPINFYHAFPPDEPIPNSRTGATPEQVEWIVGCVIGDKQKNLPVTAESLAAQLGYDKEIVVKVFDELHITETGGAA